MNNALILGPMAIPYALLLVLLAVAASVFAGTRSAGTERATVETEL